MCSKFTKEGMLNFYAGATYARIQYMPAEHSNNFNMCVVHGTNPLENRVPTVKSTGLN